MNRLAGIAAAEKMIVRWLAVICTLELRLQTAKAKPAVP
jgi:hypothetical protein